MALVNWMANLAHGVKEQDMSKDEYKRHAGKGVRWRCPCCDPKPKDRPVYRRQARRRVKTMDRVEFLKGEYDGGNPISN